MRVGGALLRLRGNWNQEMAKCGATTHLPMVPRNCILFEIARAQRGRIVISAPNSLQLLCSQRKVPFFLKGNRIFSHSIKRKSEANSEVIQKTFVFEQGLHSSPAR